MDIAISAMPTHSEAAANLLGLPVPLPVVAIKHPPPKFARSVPGYKNRANKSTPEKPDYRADGVLRLGENDVDPRHAVLGGALDEHFGGGRRGRSNAEDGQEVMGELPPRQEQGEGRDERGAVGDHHDPPGEPPRGPVAHDLPDRLRRRLYLREQLLPRVRGGEGEVQDHGLDELAQDPDRGSRDEQRGEDEADSRLEVERSQRRERLGEASRLAPQAAYDS